MSQKYRVIFIHGLSNKPPKKDLKRIWLDALSKDIENNSGFDLAAKGVKNTFIYWADLFYSDPMSVADYESRADELNASVENEIKLALDPWMESMLKKFPLDEDKIFEDIPDTAKIDTEYERIPLPWLVKKQFLKHFLQEVHDYLFNTEGMRDEIQKRVIKAINSVEADEKVVLVGHSQGAIIAYDVLTDVENCPKVHGLMTFGSPLGLDEVQDKLTWTRENGFPDKLKGSWVNVYDSFDVVARLDPKHAGDFKKDGKKVVIDVNENSFGAWRHTATKYLQGSVFRSHLRKLVDRG